MLKKYLCMLLILIVGCSRDAASNFDGTKITVSHDESNFCFDDILDYSHYVVLETAQECLIHRIDKIQIKNNTIYISDNQSKSLFSFGVNGEYITKIDAKGHGRNEYLDLTDFEVKDGGNIVIYDKVSGKLLEYDGKSVISSIKIEEGGCAIKLLKNDLIALNLGNGVSTSNSNRNYNYLCFNKKGEVVNKNIPFNRAYLGRKYTNGDGKSNFYIHNNKLYMTSMLDDYVYEIDEHTGEITPVILFDFQTHRPELNTDIHQTLSYLDDVIRGVVPSSPYALYMKGDTVMSRYTYKSQPRIMLSCVGSEINRTGVCKQDMHGLQINIIPYLDSDRSNFILSSIQPLFFDLLLLVMR